MLVFEVFVVLVMVLFLVRVEVVKMEENGYGMWQG